MIMRAALAHTISCWLLDKVDGVALNAPDANQDEKSFRSELFIGTPRYILLDAYCTGIQAGDGGSACCCGQDKS
ncbi:MAG: hypothetical protein WAK55_16825, partial [Xanthobacteraceae bacterium]